jgi:hypothetical protein
VHGFSGTQPPGALRAENGRKGRPLGNPEAAECMIALATCLPLDPGLGIPLQLRGSARRLHKRSRLIPRLSPELKREGHRVDVDRFPPSGLISLAVKFAMVDTAERNRELVADPAAEGAGLGGSIPAVAPRVITVSPAEPKGICLSMPCVPVRRYCR